MNRKCPIKRALKEGHESRSFVSPCKGMYFHRGHREISIWSSSIFFPRQELRPFRFGFLEVDRQRISQTCCGVVATCLTIGIINPNVQREPLVLLRGVQHQDYSITDSSGDLNCLQNRPFCFLTIGTVKGWDQTYIYFWSSFIQ